MTEDDKKRLLEIARDMPEGEIYIDHCFMSTVEVARAMIQNESFIESKFLGWIDNTVVFGDGLGGHPSLIVVRFKTNIPPDEMEIKFTARRTDTHGSYKTYDLGFDIIRKETMKW